MDEPGELLLLLLLGSCRGKPGGSSQSWRRVEVVENQSGRGVEDKGGGGGRWRWKEVEDEVEQLYYTMSEKGLLLLQVCFEGIHPYLS